MNIETNQQKEANNWPAPYHGIRPEGSGDTPFWVIGSLVAAAIAAGLAWSTYSRNADQAMAIAGLAKNVVELRNASSRAQATYEELKSSIAALEDAGLGIQTAINGLQAHQDAGSLNEGLLRSALSEVGSLVEERFGPTTSSLRNIQSRMDALNDRLANIPDLD